MAKATDLLSEIRKFCVRSSDPAVIAKYARYFVEGYDAYGVDPKALEAQRALWLRAHRDHLGFDGFLALGDRLVTTGKYEEGNLAVWFAMAFAPEYTPAAFERLGAWLDNGLRNWAHIDVFSGAVLSRFLIDGIVPLRAFSAWRSAPSKWKRRAVPVTLIEGLRAGMAVPRLLKFLSPMMPDPEKVVQQGLGWFLREAWKRDPAPVEAFLLKWKEDCGRIIVQYATEKMTQERKASFRRTGARAGPRPKRQR